MASDSRSSSFLSSSHVVLGGAVVGGLVVGGLASYFLFGRGSSSTPQGGGGGGGGGGGEGRNAMQPPLSVTTGSSVFARHEKIHSLEPGRVRLCSLPTPVVHLRKGFLGTPESVNISIKLDSETGCEVSGNKIRKLEYLLYEALMRNSTSVVTWGAVQSNHARATVVAARRLGLKPHVLLHGYTADQEPKGNLLLCKLFAEAVVPATSEEGKDHVRRLTEYANSLHGENVYVIPKGGSCPLGCWGYARMVSELVSADGTCHFDVVAAATGSGATIAGLLIGRELLGLSFTIWAVNVSHPAAKMTADIIALLEAFNATYGTNVVFSKCQIVDGFIGAGYAIPFAAAQATARALASESGFLLDPAYSGKAFHGLISLLSSEEVYREAAWGLKRDSNVLFVHTGGIFSVFAASVADVLPTA